MLADRMRMCSYKGKKDDPIGSIGSQDLILGDIMAGYFGTVNGLLTNTQLTSLMAMTSGTLLDSADTDITFHKFAHKGRILLIPNKPIKYTISWDNIQSQNGVKGKVISIDGQMYLCRLMTGSGHYYTSNNSVAGGEWEDLFVGFYYHNNIDWASKYTICQEVHSFGITNRVVRGFTLLTTISNVSSSTAIANFGWRPILEVL